MGVTRFNVFTGEELPNDDGMEIVTYEEQGDAGRYDGGPEMGVPGGIGGFGGRILEIVQDGKPEPDMPPPPFMPENMPPLERPGFGDTNDGDVKN